MTPIGYRLQQKLDAERRRMANEWFSKWHYIGKTGDPVKIDNFRGGNISLGGVKYAGSAVDVYWDTMNVYMKHIIAQSFDDLEKEIQAYPADVRRQSVQDALDIVRIFIREILQMASDKDCILRGHGAPAPNKRNVEDIIGKYAHHAADRAASLTSIYCMEGKSNDSLHKMANEFYDQHRFYCWIVGIILGIVALIIALITL